MIRFDPNSFTSRLGSAWNAMTSGAAVPPAASALAGAAARAAMPPPLNTMMTLGSLAGTLLSRVSQSSGSLAASAAPVRTHEQPGECSVLGLARELAPLAENSYTPSSIPGFELSRTVLGADGFAAAVYKGNVQGREQIVIAFRGTESGDTADRNQNIASHFTVPSQYRQAEQLIRDVQRQNPGKEIILTGHSLGGALAAYSGILRREPAVIFNAAGTDGPLAAALGPGMNTTAENIVQLNASCDVLTQNPVSRRIAGQPWNADATYVVPSSGSVWDTECHGISNLSNELQRASELPSRN